MTNSPNPISPQDPGDFKCPKCGETLQPLLYPSLSLLNRDQWESQIPGDLYCTCHNNTKGNNPYAYFWKHELAANPISPQSKACRNPNHALVDGSASPHEIGPSCMAEQSKAPEPPDQVEKLTPPTFHMYVWTNPSFFHAVAQATSVAEARELLLEEIGSGDGSCPEREHAAKLVRELQPSIFHRSNAEFCLTDSAELREQEAYTKTLQDKIAELMKISPSPATDKEK